MGKKEEVFNDLYAQGYEAALMELCVMRRDGLSLHAALSQLLDDVRTKKLEDHNRATDSGTLNRNTTSR